MCVASDGRKHRDKRDSEDEPGRLELFAENSQRDGNEESDEITYPNSSRRNKAREKNPGGRPDSNGGVLRQLKVLKEGVLAQTESYQVLLEEELRKNEVYRRGAIEAIDLIENQITNILKNSEDLS